MEFKMSFPGVNMRSCFEKVVFPATLFDRVVFCDVRVNKGQSTAVMDQVPVQERHPAEDKVTMCIIENGYNNSPIDVQFTNILV